MLLFGFDSDPSENMLILNCEGSHSLFSFSKLSLSEAWTTLWYKVTSGDHWGLLCLCFVAHYLVLLGFQGASPWDSQTRMSLPRTVSRFSAVRHIPFLPNISDVCSSQFLPWPQPWKREWQWAYQSSQILKLNKYQELHTYLIYIIILFSPYNYPLI